jgi:glycosyltransferase involved in cell wall biosynthesis
MQVAAGPVDGGLSGTRALRVAHLLSALHPSGAERMLQCSFELWRQHGIEPVVVGLSDEPHPFAPALRAAGYETVLVARNSRSLGGLAALRSVLVDLRPDIVHVHTESMFPLVCALARATPGVRGVVRSVHATYAYRGVLAARRVLFSQAAAALGVVSVACSGKVADNEECRYRHRPRVVENWVDVTAFTAGDLPERLSAVRKQLGLTTADFVVMLLGNCEPAKGHALMLDAIADVRQPLVGLHVGGEERADEAERLSWQRVAARHRLIRLGRRDDVATLLAAADVLAMPSEYEGFGVAAAESFCAATPVLASLAPGLAWITDFRTGRAVERHTLAWADELARARARRDSPEWMKSRHQDAADARQRFSPQRGVTEWRRVYDLALRGPARWRG